MHSKTFAAEVNKFVTESSLQTFGTVDRIKGMATLICEVNFCKGAVRSQL